jgi:glycosyltransferase involved in cell wall biosynthesis
MAAEVISPDGVKPMEQDGFTGGMPPDIKMGHFAKRQKVIVAIPAYNEEIAIGSVILGSLKHADDVVVVDDGSKDHTVEIAWLAGAKVVSHAGNRGYGAAIKTCFETAIKVDADIMVVIDADGQHNTNEIPLLVRDIVDSGSDIVIGSRFVNGNSKNQRIPAYRKLGMKVLDTATNTCAGMKLSDSQSGFRAYSRKAIHSLTLVNHDMGIGSEILIKAAESRLKISEAPITVRYDIGDTSSINPLAHGFSVLNDVACRVSLKRPVLFYYVPGAIMMAIGVLFAFLLFTIFNETRSLAVEYGIGALVFVVVGMILVSTGLTLSSMGTIREGSTDFDMNRKDNWR